MANKEHNLDQHIVLTKHIKAAYCREYRITVHVLFTEEYRCTRTVYNAVQAYAYFPEYSTGLCVLPSIPYYLQCSTQCTCTCGCTQQVRVSPLQLLLLLPEESQEESRRVNIASLFIIGVGLLDM